MSEGVNQRDPDLLVGYSFEINDYFHTLLQSTWNMEHDSKLGKQHRNKIQTSSRITMYHGMVIG